MGSLHDGEIKRAALARLRLYPNAAAMAYDNLFANRQPHARAGGTIPFNSLEEAEQFSGKPWIDANTVIPHGKAPAPGIMLHPDMHARGAPSQNLKALSSSWRKTSCNCMAL